MNHREALSATKTPSDCDGKLRTVGERYYLDVFWEDYICEKCGRHIATVEGREHHWNYELG